jgi:hypothetical protein
MRTGITNPNLIEQGHCGEEKSHIPINNGSTMAAAISRTGVQLKHSGLFSKKEMVINNTAAYSFKLFLFLLKNQIRFNGTSIRKN